MESEKLKILKGALGSYYKTRDEYLFSCPYCNHHKKKMSINISKDAYKCWICDKSGKKISYLLKKTGNRQQMSAWADLCGDVNISDFSSIMLGEKTPIKTQDKVTLPEHFISLVGLTDSEAPAPIKYLNDRGFTREHIVKWKIGYCPKGEYAKRVVIPSFNSSGRLNYYVARLYASGWNKYKNPPASRDIVFNELNIDWNSDITLVEGVFDAMRVGNAIPLLGSSLRENSDLFNRVVENCKVVYLALDSDAERKARKITDLFLQYGISVCKIPLGKFSDVGEMSQEQFAKQKSLASFIERDDYLLYKALTL